MSDFDYAAHGLRATRRPGIPGGRPTVGAVLDWGVATRPDSMALIGRNGRYTYRQLAAVVNRAAGAMIAAGIGRFDRVAACLPNDVEIVIAFLATLRIGAVWVGLPRILSLPEKVFVLEDAGVSLLLAEKALEAQLATRGTGAPALARIWNAEPGDAHSEWSTRLRGASEDLPPGPPIDPFAPAVIAYTSGTTGFPKGVVHSQHNMLVPGAVAVAGGEFGPQDNTGVVLPLTIPNLLIVQPLILLQAGGTTIVIDRTRPQELADWIRRERIIHLIAVPTLYHDLLSQPGLLDGIDSFTRPECGGADMAEESRRLFRQRFGRDVQVTYGLTEAPTRVTRVSDTPVAGACGQVCAHLTLEVLDENGSRLGPNEVGEIWVAPRDTGPFAGLYTPFLGYWMRPEATHEALRDGHLNTGDLGCLDDAGNLFIKGRRKELILRAGSNVYPAEVERVLDSDRRVRASAVLGVPDVRLGERVVAFVQFEPDQTASFDELRALCEANLARYKVPAEFHVVSELPRNAMGKIVKPKLAASLATPAP